MESQQHKIFHRYRLLCRRVLTVAGLILLPLLIGGCNALERGDFLQQTDDTMLFSSIGFLMSDNPELYRNAVTDVSGTLNDIYISIPYYETDGITPLLPDTMKLTFDVVGKDTIVLLDGVTPINPGDIVDFHDGAGNPYPRLFTIYKQVIGSESPQSSDVWVHVTKTIKPKLMNPHQPGVPAPLILELAFVDENGTKVDMTSNNYDTGRTYWDNWRLDMPAAPGYQAGSDSFEVPNVRPYYPGDHPITIDEDCFFDNNGYYSQYGEVNLFYAPPAIHISTRVGGPGSGTGSKDDPFYSWDQAITELTLFPGTYFDIFIEASETPYELDTGAVIFNGINGPANFLNIYGGYKPYFDGRYDGDWENRPQSILIATNQTPGTTDVLPGPAFTMNSVGNDFVLDNLLIISSDVLFGTALLIDNASPKISDITLGAAKNSMVPGSAMTVLNGSNLTIANSRFFGKSGGAGKSTGIYVDNSFLELHGSLITGGDLTDICHGIELQFGILNIFGGAIISGMIDAETDNFIETENKGIFALNSNVNLHNLWIHTADGIGISTALEVNNTPAFIENSTFISGRTPIPRGIYILNGGGNFELYNSVVRVANSNGAGDAAGIRIENAGLNVINGNAIRIGSGGGPNQTFGIDLINSPAVEIHNNLIWSGSSGDMLGIRSDLAIPGAPIRHNNFWHTGGDAKLELIPGTQLKIYDWQNPINPITGNFSLPVAIDMAFDYATDDMDVGRILGSVPNDICYGGEDLFGMFPDFDREGRLRTAEDGVGWSIGPYE